MPYAQTSVSQIECWRLCRRKWWFKSIQKVREPVKPSAQLGIDIHDSLEHYLNTGNVRQDYCVEFVKLAIPYLPAPARPGRLLTEHEIRVGTYEGGPYLLGYIDVVDLEAYPLLVHDHKTCGSFNFLKTPDELARNTQVSAYARWVFGLHPAIDRVKMTHLYLRTKGGLAARPVSAVVDRALVEETWARDMADVRCMAVDAEVTEQNDIPRNDDGCAAFGGCYLRNNLCQKERIFAVKKEPEKMSDQNGNGNGISLFEQLNRQTGVAMPIAPPPPSAAPNPAQTPTSFFAPPASTPSQAVQPPPGTAQALFGAPAAAPVAFPGHPGGAPGAFQPSQAVPAPQVASAPAAQTMTADEFVEYLKRAHGITAPGRPYMVGEAAREYARIAGFDLPPEGGITGVGPAGGWPPIGTLIPVLAPEAASRVTPVSAAPAPDLVAQAGAQAVPGAAAVVAPRKRRTKAEIAAAKDAEARAFLGIAVPAPPVVTAPVITAPVITAPVVTAPVVTAPTRSAAPFVEGVVVFADGVVDAARHKFSGMVENLNDYVGRLCRRLEAQHLVNDIRNAMGDNPLAYGRWKGALAALVRSEPPEPGVYTLRIGTDDSPAAIVYETLYQMPDVCQLALRGSR